MEHSGNNTTENRILRWLTVPRLYYIKLIFRASLFVLALALYLSAVKSADGAITNPPSYLLAGLFIIWLIFMVEMILRFFPSRLESMGCQKQFAGSFRSTDRGRESLKPWSAKSTLIVAGVWIALNAAIGVVYFMHLIDKAVLILISLAFSVCDIICILFYCPFQHLIMKNKCCVNCRIYNWDYAMMFTPLIFIPGIFTWSLLFVAIALLIRWEAAFHRHPERFSEITNASLRCVNCQDKLCAFKKRIAKNRSARKQAYVHESNQKQS